MAVATSAGAASADQDVLHHCQPVNRESVRQTGCNLATDEPPTSSIVSYVIECTNACGNAYSVTVEFSVNCQAGYQSDGKVAYPYSAESKLCPSELPSEASRRAASALKRAMAQPVAEEEIHVPAEAPANSATGAKPAESVYMLPRPAFYLVEARAADPAKVAPKEHWFRATGKVKVALPFKVGRDVAAGLDFGPEHALRGLQIIRREVRASPATPTLVLTADEKYELERLLLELGKKPAFSLPRQGVCGQLVFRDAAGKFGDPVAMPITIVEVVKFPDGRLERVTQSLVWKCEGSGSRFEPTGKPSVEPLREKLSADSVEGPAPAKVSPADRKPEAPVAPTQVAPVKMGTNPGR